MNPNPKKKLSPNIWKLTVSEISYNFGLVWAIYILFFQYLGYGYDDIGLYEAICSITIIITEMGTGALADLIGRKWAIIIGNLSFFTMALLLGLGQGGMTILILVGVFSGLDFSFRSGATTALLYDFLLQESRETDFLTVSGKIRGFTLISQMVGMVSGSYLFNINPRLPYWVWSGFLLVSVILILTVQEPVKASHKIKWSHIWSNMVGSIKYILKSRVLLWMVGFFLLADVFAESYWDIFSQAHLELGGLTHEGIGILFAALTGISGVASYFIGNIEQKLGEKRLLYLIILIQAIIYLLMAIYTHWLWLSFLLIGFTINRNFSGLLEENYRNAHIPSDIRAGVLSAASFLKNGIFGGWAVIWIYGIAMTRFDFRLVLVGSSVLLLLIGLILLYARKFQKPAEL